MAAALLVLMGASTGCIGLVRNRLPRAPAGERNVRVERTPVIALEFTCSANGEPEAGRVACDRQRRAMTRTVKKFDFMARSRGEDGDPEYRLIVSASWTSKEWPGVACGYALMVFVPCNVRDRLETSAQLLRSDGTVVGRAEASADRIFIVHATGIWLFPGVLPTLPAYVRFSSNTYSSLLGQVGVLLRDDVKEGRAVQPPANSGAPGAALRRPAAPGGRPSRRGRGPPRSRRLPPRGAAASSPLTSSPGTPAGDPAASRAGA